MTDPISDFLTRLRNASKAKLDECVIPHSNLKESVAAILKTEGYVSDHSNGADAQGHKHAHADDEADPPRRVLQLGILVSSPS